jgi:hypothetical protein
VPWASKLGGKQIPSCESTTRTVSCTRQVGTPGLDQLADVALDSSNNVYVASVDTTTTLVIRKFNANGTLLRTIINTDPNIRDVTALGVDSV